MTSTIKVNNIQNQCGANIINESANTITIGASGDTISLAAGASQTGFGRTGTVDWDTTAKTASFTAVSGNGYFVNTTSGAITVTLPAGSAGDIVSLADYTNTWQTNNVTVTPNGTDKIGGVNNNATLSIEGQSVTFVYVDGTEGWKSVQDSTSNVTGKVYITATGGTITTCGNCKIHTFTSPGTFCVSQISTTAPENIVSYMVVAGGGGGGSGNGGGGGGGAGGFRELKSPVTTYTASPLDGYPSAPNRITVTASPYPIAVGGGGTGAGGSAPDPEAGTNGSNSSFSTITSAGGGAGGASPTTSPPFRNGLPGGSGGGASGSNCATGGTGNTPPVSPAQGFNGGNSFAPPCSGGGGGGATSIGANGASGAGGNGGNGAGTGINPSCTVGTPGPSAPLRYFSGGGGGMNETPGGVPNQGVGGYGGGADGDVPGSGGNNGTANTGGGGGGIDNVPSVTATHNGGSGIVIIRYKYQN